MEISPSELRDSEIREAFRGYHRDDVNDLLERAASTIEALAGRVRELGDRLAQAESAPAAAGRTRELEEMLERTLLLARRAAEDEVSEAQAKSRQLVDDAEAKARRLLADAEFDVRRRTEEERNRLANELVDLGQRREALTAYVAELDRFESEYRERLIRSIEADLAVIGGRAPAAPDSRPEPVDVEIPVLAESVLLPDADGGPPTHEISLVEESAAGDASEDDLEAAPAGPPAPPPALVRGPEGFETPTDAVESERSLDLVEAEPEPASTAMLDDDAFFAQLRDAVSDDRPASDGEATFFDQDIDEIRATGDLFGRRR